VDFDGDVDILVVGGDLFVVWCENDGIGGVPIFTPHDLHSSLGI
jgi:hypothetical protein